MVLIMRWIALVFLVALSAEGPAFAFSASRPAERFPGSLISARSADWLGSLTITVLVGEQRVSYGYDRSTVCLCAYDQIVGPAF